MYNFSFICRASKIDKKGFAPIELSIIINGTRTYVILPMKYEPTLFNKMMTSKKNNEVLEYTSSVRTKLNKCIAEKNFALLSGAARSTYIIIFNSYSSLPQNELGDASMPDRYLEPRYPHV